jgi:hypothetical protein
MHRDGQNSNRKAVSRDGPETAIVLAWSSDRSPRPDPGPPKFLSDIVSSAYNQHGPRRLVKLLCHRSCRRPGRVLAPSKSCTGARTRAEAVARGYWHRAGAADRCGSGEVEIRIQGGACIYREKSKCKVPSLLTRLVDPRRPGCCSRERASKAGQAETRWGLSCRLLLMAEYLVTSLYYAAPPEYSQALQLVLEASDPTKPLAGLTRELVDTGIRAALASGNADEAVKLASTTKSLVGAVVMHADVSGEHRMRAPPSLLRMPTSPRTGHGVSCWSRGS